MTQDEGPTIVAQSPAMIKLLEQVSKVATWDVPIQTQGEMGTGKELHYLRLKTPTTRILKQEGLLIDPRRGPRAHRPPARRHPEQAGHRVVQSRRNSELSSVALVT